MPLYKTLPTHPFADDTESFITKEAAKELRHKLSSSIEQQDDYDEILKDIIRGLRVKPKTDQQIIYEKKYFDYLPNDIVDSEDVTSEDLTQESINLNSSNDDNVSSVKRNKRDTSVREKRHFFPPGVEVYHQPLQLISSSPFATIYIPDELFSDYSNHISTYSRPRTFYPSLPIPNYPQPSFSSQFNLDSRFYNPGNPYHNPTARFHPPGNFYLPPDNRK